MISLRPMREDEFSSYLDSFIREFAVEVASNYGIPESAALEQVKREMASDLPDGIHTAGQVLTCLIDATQTPERLVGYLWYRQDLAAQVAFIMDFSIFPAYQGQGFGKQALKALEQDLKRKGFAQIKLRVAPDNQRARHVYDVTGFRVTGIHMSKPLDRNRA